MYLFYVMNLSIKCLVLFKALEVCIGLAVYLEASDRETLVNRSLNEVPGKELDTTSSDLWSMVASMKANADSTGSRVNDQGGSKKASSRLDWEMNLDQNGSFQLAWSVEYATNLITFSLGINQTSSRFRKGSDIFALGFSKDGRLHSSDFCIIWYDLGHRLHVQDALTNEHGRLELVEANKSHCKLISTSKLHQAEDGIEISLEFQEKKEEESGGLLGSNLIEEPGSVGDHELSHQLRSRIDFRRPLDVCSNEGSGNSYYTIDNGTTHLLWFTLKGPLLSIDGLNIGELAEQSSSSKEHQKVTSGGERKRVEDPMWTTTMGGDNRFSYGMKRVQLIAVKPRGREERLMGGSRRKGVSLDIRMESFSIPAQETTYWCKLFKFPHRFSQRRYHITRYEALIERGNEHVVHHMELFHCANLESSQELELEQLYKSAWSGDCNGLQRPEATKSCKRVILAWAMGAHPLEYPEQVGQSVGGRGYSPYIVLEVHYNNVNKRGGLIDNSGLSFQYTSKLRPYDAGILEVGLEYTDKNSIPPSQVVPLAGHCVGECTRVAMTEAMARGIQRTGGGKSAANETGGHLEEGIYIFAAQMHTHLAGVASWTEHIREGRLVGELQRDNHYSPHFQEIRLLSEPVHIAPGDGLIHYCLYDTRDRRNITLGGYATSEEMCVTYLHYYPRIDLEVCKSSIDTDALEAYFAYLAKEEGQKTSLSLREKRVNSVDSIYSSDVKSVRENYQSIEWTPRRARDLVKLYADAPLSIQCNRSNGDRFPGYWTGYTAANLARVSQLGGEEEARPSEAQRSSGRQLIEYRGSGFEQRHERCGPQRRPERSSRT